MDGEASTSGIRNFDALTLAEKSLSKNSPDIFEDETVCFMFICYKLKFLLLIKKIMNFHVVYIFSVRKFTSHNVSLEHVLFCV